MKWNIVTDSSYDLFDLERKNENISYSDVPFVINVGEHDFVDNEELNTSDMINAEKACKDATHTSCPAPYAWYEKFAVEGNVIAVTISKELSGSYNSACVARTMALEDDEDKKIAVINSCSTGPAMVMVVRKICSLIESGIDFETVVSHTQSYVENIHTVFALSSFNNLVKNGRMNKLVGLFATTFDFWGIGVGESDGRISFKKKTRGEKKVISCLIEDIIEKGIFDKSAVICHCNNVSLAERLRDEIMKIRDSVEVTIIQTRGLDSYYAEMSGLIVSY